MMEGTYTHADFMQNNTNPIGDATTLWSITDILMATPCHGAIRKPAAKPVPLHGLSWTYSWRPRAMGLSKARHTQ